MNYAEIDNTGRVLAVRSTPGLLPGTGGTEVVPAPGLTEGELRHYYWDGAAFAAKGASPIAGPVGALTVGTFAVFSNIPAGTQLTLVGPDYAVTALELAGPDWELHLPAAGRYKVTFEPVAHEPTQSVFIVAP